MFLALSILAPKEAIFKHFALLQPFQFAIFVTFQNGVISLLLNVFFDPFLHRTILVLFYGRFSHVFFFF